MKSVSIKVKLIIFLAILGLSLSLKDKNTAFMFACVIALVSSIAADSLVTFLKEKRLSITESSVISGLIIAFVLASDNRWWIIASCSILAIFSKHFIRFKGKHLFNPAGFGILLCTLCFGAQTQWMGTYLWYILVPAGLYFVYKIRKIWLLSAYFISALFIFGIQALIRRQPVADILGYFSYFFVFIMLIEPKTTPHKFYAQLIFGFGVACLIFILTQAGVNFDVEIASLLILNLLVPVLNRIPERGKR